MKAIRSYWRRAHLTLASVSSVFLIITSVTGVILSFEPVSNRMHASHIANANNSSIGSIIEQLESSYLEVIELKIDENQLLHVSIVNMDEEFETFLADPNTGKKVEEAMAVHPMFSFSRTLHRSLFSGSIGRLIIGITSFLLFFIAVSGFVLLVQRQLGWRKFLSKVKHNNSDSYWHTVIGRWSLPLLAIISLSGTFLSMDRFELLPKETEIKHTINFDTLTDSPSLEKKQFELFKTTQLKNVESIQFPFSPDIEDYYQIRLKDRDVIVNQFNGSIISQVRLNQSSQFGNLVFNLHTGKANVYWSVILGVTSLSILFFIVTGIKIALRRRQNPKKNNVLKENASIVLLVGSEGGETAIKAQQLFESLTQNGQKIYIDQLNNYQKYESMKHLLIFTSTYGEGQAPSNSDKFLRKFPVVAQSNSFTFSVVGFGSTNYLKYCQFAHDVQHLLQQQNEAKTPLCCINNQSIQQLNHWLLGWSNGMNVSVAPFKVASKRTAMKTQTFTIIKGSSKKTKPGDSFQLILSSKNGKYHSGDLLAIQPKLDTTERYYSIGKNYKGQLLLSIKLHEKGLCSNQLNAYSEGDELEARIQENKAFRFPEKARKIICISNGTGIAPFIGMANENYDKKRFDLYWGGRFQQDLDKYNDEIRHVQNLRQLASFQYALSREGEKQYQYVQDLIRGDQNNIANSLLEGAVILICGSNAMRDDVLKVLEKICAAHTPNTLKYFQNRGQLKIDCY